MLKFIDSTNISNNLFDLFIKSIHLSTLSIHRIIYVCTCIPFSLHVVWSPTPQLCVSFSGETMSFAVNLRSKCFSPSLNSSVGRGSPSHLPGKKVPPFPMISIESLAVGIQNFTDRRMNIYGSYVQNFRNNRC